MTNVTHFGQAPSTTENEDSVFPLAFSIGADKELVFHILRPTPLQLLSFHNLMNSKNQEDIARFIEVFIKTLVQEDRDAFRDYSEDASSQIELEDIMEVWSWALEQSEDGETSEDFQPEPTDSSDSSPATGGRTSTGGPRRVTSRSTSR